MINSFLIYRTPLNKELGLNIREFEAPAPAPKPTQTSLFD